jgi:hypothetical protein
MESRLWYRLGQNINQEQKNQLENLLTNADDNGRQSLLDKLRKGPVRVGYDGSAK